MRLNGKNVHQAFINLILIILFKIIKLHFHHRAGGVSFLEIIAICTVTCLLDIMIETVTKPCIFLRE